MSAAIDPIKAAKKKKRDIFITSILLVIFAFTFTKNVLIKRKPTIEAPAASEAISSLSDQLVYVTNLRVYDKLRDEQKKVWDREWLRDPFVPASIGVMKAKAVNLTLKGVLWDEVHPKAIVNERTLSKGDTLYGYTVMNIKPRSVVLKTGEKSIELTVFGIVPLDAPATA